MKKFSSVFFVCFLVLCLAISTQAQPGPGIYSSPDDFAAGNWKEILYGGSEGAPGNEIQAESVDIYTFDGAILDNVVEDEAGSDYIKYITEYIGGTLELINGSSTPWYNSGDGVSYIITLGPAINQTWKYDNEEIAFELTATGEFENYPGYRAKIIARYSRGTPGLSGSDPEEMVGTLSWAQITISGPVAVDIKPGSCPNPINTKSKGVLPVAILGTESFDVDSIDPESIQLIGVSPIRWSWEDVSSPSEPLIGKNGAYDCNENGPDGFDDLTLKFKTKEIVSALGQVNDGDELNLELNAELVNGTAVIGEDVVIIRHKGKKDPGPRAVLSCESEKLKAAAKLCSALIACNMKELKTQDFGSDAFVEKARNKFTSMWNRAETKAEKKGADCPTAELSEIENIILPALADINQISEGIDTEEKDAVILAHSLLKAAGKKCSSILIAESKIIRHPDADKLSAAITRADEKFEKFWNNAMTKALEKGVIYSGPSMSEVEAMIDGLITDVLASI